MPDLPDRSGRRVLIPGGTGAVGEGAVRAHLAAGADVVVPTRSPAREREFRNLLGDAATSRLHLTTHDYTTFAGAEQLALTMTERLGGIDDVVAPIGGWWAGKRLQEIDETDWNDAFTGLATAHMAIARAVMPRLTGQGAYSIVVGESATFPVPGSGLVSMEQAAVLMMQGVLAAEAGERQRVFALVLGPVSTRLTPAVPGQVSADRIGAVTVALASAGRASGVLLLRSDDEAVRVLADLATPPR